MNELGIDTKKIESYENAKGLICMRLVNTDVHREMLMDVPYVDYLADIAIVFYVDIDDDQFLTISDKLMDFWGVDTETMYNQAMRNTMSRFPLQVGKYDGFSYEAFVLTTNEAFGAVVMVYEGINELIAENVGGAFYLVPISTHNVLVFPAKPGVDAYAIRNMDLPLPKLEKDNVEYLSDCMFYCDGKDLVVQ